MSESYLEACHGDLSFYEGGIHLESYDDPFTKEYQWVNASCRWQSSVTVGLWSWLEDPFDGGTVTG